MKYIFTVLVGCLTMKGFAQKPFEGKISYVISSPRDKQDARLLACFGRNKIRLELHDANNLREPDYVIVSLDSEKVYAVSPSAKTFRASSLQMARSPNAEVINEVAGQKTTTVLPTAQGINFLGGVLPSATLYVADSLLFPVSEKFAGNQFLSIVQKGRIVLGVKVDLGSQYPDAKKDSSENNQNLMSVMADFISVQRLNDTLFTVPAGFNEFTYNSTPNLTYRDSVAASADTGTVTQTKPAKKRSTKSPAKSKPTNKPSPLRRKDD